MQPKFGVGDEVFYFSYGTGKVLEVQPTPDNWTAKWRYKIQFEKVTAILVENPRLILFETEKGREMANQYTKAAQLAAGKKQAKMKAAKTKQVKKMSEPTKQVDGLITIRQAVEKYPEYKRIDHALVADMRAGKVANAAKVGRTWYFPEVEVTNRLLV